MKSFILFFLAFIISTHFTFGQTTISGTVTDEKANPLPGVSVLAKGTKISTMTDHNGKYSISVTAYVNSLVFSYIGMETIEKEITGNIMNITMTATEAELDEVVVSSISIKRDKRTLAYSTRSDYSRKSAYAPKGESAYKPVSSEHSDGITTFDTDVSGGVEDGENSKVKSGLLTAGELNDYGKWELWKDISSNELKTYKSAWQMQPIERYCVQLTNYSDRPVVNADVYLQTVKGDTLWKAKTDNTGKAELWLNIFDSVYSENDLIINIAKNNHNYKLNKPEKFHNGINFMNIPVNCNVPEKADIAFVVDATGSMGDEIAYLKAELEDVLNKIKKQHKDIQVNTSSVFYRDHGDSYLVKKSDFSTDIKTSINFINEQNAGGGGDFPEAVDAGLNTAINELSWSDDALAKVIFLILDAPPHADRESIKNMQKLTEKAAEKGIRIVPVTASGIDKSTEYLMRSIALATNGTYVFLTDDSGIGNAHIKPTTDEYQVEFLNDVFIRLIKQYLTIPDCGEEIVYDNNEIQDTSYIVDNSVIKDSISGDTSNLTDIQVIKEPGKVKYYPNPTVDVLNIEISGEMEEMFLADVSGKILQRFDIKNQNNFRINIGRYPAGIYFIQYQNGERWQTGKVILTNNI